MVGHEAGVTADAVVLSPRVPVRRARGLSLPGTQNVPRLVRLVKTEFDSNDRLLNRRGFRGQQIAFAESHRTIVRAPGVATLVRDGKRRITGVSLQSPFCVWYYKTRVLRVLRNSEACSQFDMLTGMPGNSPESCSRDKTRKKSIDEIL